MKHSHLQKRVEKLQPTNGIWPKSGERWPSWLIYTYHEEDDETTRRAKMETAAAKRGKKPEDFDRTCANMIVSNLRRLPSGQWDTETPIETLVARKAPA